MARFVIGDTLGDLGFISDFLNPNALSPVVQTVTVDRYEDPEGDGFELGGTGFSYAGLVPIGGTVKTLDVFTAAGDPLITVTGLNTSLAQLYQVLSFGSLDLAYIYLTDGNDRFIGSANADLLESGKGNDTLIGNAGADFLHGSKGRDVMTGGAGPDKFVFAAGDGVDRITDFRDLNGPADDLIAITKNMYNTMTRTETLTGVELDFGTRGTLVVDGWHLVDVGRSDFVFI